MRVFVMVLLLLVVGCESPEVEMPDASDTPCGVGDHPCCPADDPEGRPPCVEGYRCEDERGKGYFECNPDLPPDEPPPPEEN